MIVAKSSLSSFYLQQIKVYAVRSEAEPPHKLQLFGMLQYRMRDAPLKSSRIRLTKDFRFSESARPIYEKCKPKERIRASKLLLGFRAQRNAKPRLTHLPQFAVENWQNSVDYCEKAERFQSILSENQM